MKLTKVGAVAAVAVIALGACQGGTGSKSVKFAIELPLQGSEKAASDPIINGIRLARRPATTRSTFPSRRSMTTR